jgi:hypothetical protein
MLRRNDALAKPAAGHQMPAESDRSRVITRPEPCRLAAIIHWQVGCTSEPIFVIE